MSRRVWTRVLLSALTVSLLFGTIWSTGAFLLCRDGPAPVVLLVLAGAAFLYLVAFPIVRSVVKRRRGGPASEVGAFIWWVAVAMLVLVLVLPQFGGIQPRVRISKANAEARGLAAGVSAYAAHMGALPETLSSLTAPATNAQGKTAGPFLGTIPRGSCTWSDYRYERRADGTFSITTSSQRDGVTVTVP